MPALAPIGRVLLSLIFLFALPGHFKHEMIAHARDAGVPLANVAVPLAGIIAFAGGLMVALGFHARIGAVLLIVFLLPVTLFMHKFWGMSDPQLQQMQMVNFLKNLGLIGASAFIVYAGAGAYSLDAKAGRIGELHAHAHW
jgi:putative oxidoreductase